MRSCYTLVTPTLPIHSFVNSVANAATKLHNWATFGLLVPRFCAWMAANVIFQWANQKQWCLCHDLVTFLATLALSNLFLVAFAIMNLLAFFSLSPLPLSFFFPEIFVAKFFNWCNGLPRSIMTRGSDADNRIDEEKRGVFLVVYRHIVMEGTMIKKLLREVSNIVLFILVFKNSIWGFHRDFCERYHFAVLANPHNSLLAPQYGLWK